MFPRIHPGDISLASTSPVSEPHRVATGLATINQAYSTMSPLGKKLFRVVVCSLALGSCASASAATGPSRYMAGRGREIRALLAAPTSSSLATAAMLATSIPTRHALALKAAARAVALAPKAADLAWLQWMICNALRCRSAALLREHLAAVAPDNGFAREEDLLEAQAAGSQASATVALRQIAGAGRMTTYWNPLQVMAVDALARALPSRDLPDRLLEATGLVGALTIPPLAPFARACNVRQLGLPGRRAACQAVMTRLEHADTVLAQRVALSVEATWWPAGSPPARAITARRRQSDYLLFLLTRMRGRSVRDDATLRLAAARRTASEQAVELTVLEAHHLPPTPPPDWKDPWNS